MPGTRSLSRAALLAAALLSGAAAEAGQRTGTLAVSVQVVTSCSASTGTAGLTQTCDTTAAPVAVLREQRSAATVPVATAADAPVARTQDETGIVTVVY